MAPEEALRELQVIRGQLHRMRWAGCFRATTIAGSGGLALLAAGCQSWWLPDPLAAAELYVLYWSLIALASVLLIGSEIAIRLAIESSPYARQQTCDALLEFAPCLLVGAVGTVGMLTQAPNLVAVLPALWAMLFAVGLFAARQRLPVAGRWVGVFYVLMAVVCLRHSGADLALAPWMMGVTFGGGQLLAAAVLWFERSRD
jgi:hypothetical protein